jgi:hypothetical protein
METLAPSNNGLFYAKANRNMLPKKLRAQYHLALIIIFRKLPIHNDHQFSKKILSRDEFEVDDEAPSHVPSSAGRFEGCHSLQKVHFLTQDALHSLLSPISHEYLWDFEQGRPACYLVLV